MPVQFALVLHAHQPVGNFDHVIEEAYRTSYWPFLQAAEAAPDLRINLHFSGFLLDWIAERHPELIELLRRLIRAGRLEMLGGAYFEPILAAIPFQDRLRQIEKLRRTLDRLFGVEPAGFWLAERVWEPELPHSLGKAGVNYALLDDTHFLMTGLEEERTWSYFLSEHEGVSVRLVPSNQFLRFAIPFRPVEESIRFLLEAGERRPDALLTMGDDLEKFGTWPRTFQHVYDDGWLGQFFQALAAERERIRTVRLSEVIATQPPQGLVYLPTASYAEMMQWALPMPAAAQFQQALESPGVAPYRRFLAGAPWRSFLSKYREANLMQKTAWDLSRRLHELESPELAPADRVALDRAQQHLLAAQCNDAYWHGLFGGLYAPHLRDSVQSHLIAADALIEPVQGGVPLRRFDLDLDGREEVELRTPHLRLLLSAADGGCVEALDFRPKRAALINSLQRRPEVYHERIRERAAYNPANLPGTAAADTFAEANLDAWLDPDRWPRSCGRLCLFPPGQRLFAADRAESLQRRLIDEAIDPEWAAGLYRIEAATAGRVELERSSPGGRASKRLHLRDAEGAGLLACRCDLSAELAVERQAGIEMIFNLLAPAASDRALCLGERRERLSWHGIYPAGALALEDGWRGLRIDLEAAGAEGWWIDPIYSISQSEAGFERVYQGSRLLAWWPVGARQLRLQVRVRAL